MVGGKIGGVNVFGGGLALYNSQKVLIGAIGVSGDSSCADHNIAWRTRNGLGLDYVPAGVSGDATRPDNIVYDITPQVGQMPGVSAGGWDTRLAVRRQITRLQAVQAAARLTAVYRLAVESANAGKLNAFAVLAF